MTLSHSDLTFVERIFVLRSAIKETKYRERAHAWARSRHIPRTWKKSLLHAYHRKLRLSSNT